MSEEHRFEFFATYDSGEPLRLMGYFDTGGRWSLLNQLMPRYPREWMVVDTETGEVCLRDNSSHNGDYRDIGIEIKEWILKVEKNEEMGA